MVVKREEEGEERSLAKAVMSSAESLAKEWVEGAWVARPRGVAGEGAATRGVEVRGIAAAATLLAVKMERAGAAATPRAASTTLRPPTRAAGIIDVIVVEGYVVDHEGAAKGRSSSCSHRMTKSERQRRQVKPKRRIGGANCPVRSCQEFRGSGEQLSAVLTITSIMEASSSAAAAASSSSSTGQEPRIDSLVLDAGPLLAQLPLRGMAKKFYVPPMVMAELKDKKARDHLEFLKIGGLDLEVREAGAESLAAGKLDEAGHLLIAVR